MIFINTMSKMKIKENNKVEWWALYQTQVYKFLFHMIISPQGKTIRFPWNTFGNF